MYIVYVLYSRLFDKIYIGCTSNLEQRLISHNHLGKKGWTIHFRPWTLIYHECFQTKQEALDRESKLKTGKGRQWIRTELIIKGQ